MWRAETPCSARATTCATAFQPCTAPFPLTLPFCGDACGGPYGSVLAGYPTGGLTQLGMMPSQAPLKGFPRVGEQMKAVGDLHRSGSRDRGSGGVVASPVAADNVHLGMAL